MNKLIEKQLELVTEADLSNYDESANAYFIPKKVGIKLEEDCCYLIHCKSTLYNNESLRTNWNNNSIPECNYLKVEVNKIMSNMIKVVGVGYDFNNKSVLNYFWSGWLTKNDIEVLEKI